MQNPSLAQSFCPCIYILYSSIQFENSLGNSKKKLIGLKHYVFYKRHTERNSSQQII